ncbi:MAG: hypothetical protein CSB44_08965 [Gammaproteobacteria bacterium]|nr:MAG: hypothetical protein CSB44_08965 [Gammaproteobacteria bacterium]PIE36794.1 MAG: hypothetical protein CSA54_03250 [Gammaproteobacteria bacterium]
MMRIPATILPASGLLLGAILFSATAVAQSDGDTDGTGKAEGASEGMSLDAVSDELDALGAAGREAPGELSVEELEKLLAEQKAALAEVEESLEETRRKEAAVRERIDKKVRKQSEVEAEIETLCREREKLEAGSFDRCMAEGD